MIDSLGQFYSGFLMSCPSGAVTHSNLTGLPHLSGGNSVGSSHWESFTFTSSRPLAAEDPRIIPGPYRYSVLCRRSGSRIIIASRSRHITSILLETSVQKAFTPPLQNIPILIDSLVDYIVSNPECGYGVAFLHARLAGYQPELNAISAYGEDITSSGFFKANREYMSVFSCGLTNSKESREAIRVSSLGGVSFQVTSIDDLLFVERTIGFLRQMKFLRITSS